MVFPLGITTVRIVNTSMLTVNSGITSSGASKMTASTCYLKLSKSNT